MAGFNGLYPYVFNRTTNTYTEITHPESGPFFSGGSTSITEDGKTVIGYFRPWPGGPFFGEGFIWTEETGRVNLNEYVSSKGIDLGEYILALPLAISADGSKIVGVARTEDFKQYGFMVDLTEDLNINHDLTKNGIKIYPNPASETINISGLNKISQVEIFNVAGQKMITVKEKASGINIQHLPQGTYILKVTADGKTTNHKFIKK